MAREREKYVIMDDGGIIWSSDEYDAFEEGCRILGVLEDGGTVEEIGATWSGDLVLLKEIRRTR